MIVFNDEVLCYCCGRWVDREDAEYIGDDENGYPQYCCDDCEEDKELEGEEHV